MESGDQRKKQKHARLLEDINDDMSTNLFPAWCSTELAQSMPYLDTSGCQDYRGFYGISHHTWSLRTVFWIIDYSWRYYLGSQSKTFSVNFSPDIKIPVFVIHVFVKRFLYSVLELTTWLQLAACTAQLYADPKPENKNWKPLLDLSNWFWTKVPAFAISNI